MKLNLKKNLIFFSIFLILILSLGIVSASEDGLNDPIMDVELSSYNPSEDVLYNSNNDLNNPYYNMEKDNCIYGDSNSLNDNLGSNIFVYGNTFEDIQNAIDYAKDGDTIELNSTYVSTGNEIKVNKSIKILGTSNTLLDGMNKSKIFFINSSNVTLSNLNLINCRNEAIDWRGNNGNLLNCNFKNCEGSYEIISWIGYRGSLANSTFENCNAYRIIYWEGQSGFISKCNFTNNYNSIISWEGKYGYISECNFTNNRAYRLISFSNASNYVSDCNFLYNYLSQSVIYINGNRNGVTRNNFIGNNVNDTVIYWRSSYGVLSNCNFINNSAFNEKYSVNGGAVCWEGSYGSLSDCNFINTSSINNRYIVKGGAVFWSGYSGILSNCNFINNSAFGDGIFGVDGGAVYWNGTNGTLKFSNFVNNRAYSNTSSLPNGGAIMWEGHNSSLFNCNFVNNSAYGFYNNSSRSNFVLYWRGNNSFIANCSFMNDPKMDFLAMYLSASNCILNNCSFENFHCYKNGGALFVFGDNSSLINCKFMNNIARSGGAFYWWGNNGLVINCTFINNFANPTESILTGGGAIHWLGMYGTLINCTFINNSDMRGSSILWNGINQTIYHCYFDRDYNLINGTLEPAVSIEDTNIIRKNVKLSYYEGNLTYYFNHSNSIKFLLNDNGKPLSNRFVNFYLDNEDCGIFETDENGLVCLNKGLSTLFAGNHTITAYLMSFTYNISNFKLNVEVLPLNSSLKVNNLTGEYNCETSLDVTVVDEDNKLINSGNVYFYQDNKFIGEGLVQNGHVVLKFIPNETGLLNIRVIYNSAKIFPNYLKSNNSFTLNVNKRITKINSSSLISTYNDGSYLVATLLDNYNKVVPGVNVTLSINNTEENLETDNNGQIRFNISNLIPNNYQAILNFEGNDFYEASSNNVDIFINQSNTKVIASSVNTVYQAGKYLIVTLKDPKNNVLFGKRIQIKVGTISKNIYTNDKGQVSVLVSNLVPKTYTATIKFEGDENYTSSSKTAKIVVKKATPKITASAKTFKIKTKTKSYTITLKNNKNKAMKNTKVTIKVNGKTYTAKTNTKGQATFKITKLTKRGTFNAVITYAGNKYYNKITKKVKITVKK